MCSNFIIMLIAYLKRWGEGLIKIEVTMADSNLDTSKDYLFRDVQIFKSETIGSGPYRTVYRAKCDELPCVAKMLHPLLVTPHSESRRLLQHYEQQCHFLRGLRHPNIVQYLGTWRDPESDIPVLLMELMDEDLTHFLERSPEPLPYYLQVNLCHDIAMALAYLHSSGIMYCDLTSCDVLLKHKMAKLGSTVVMQKIGTEDLTRCPGSLVYMAPEALSNPPTYCEKIDIFSFGVLGIQILTREFPDPGALCYRQSEVERRRSHIDKVDPNHPLLPLFLNCLEDLDRNRPTAKTICGHLAALKETLKYTSSAEHQQHPSDRRDIERLQAELSEITAAKQEAETALLQKEQQFQLSERERDGMRQQLEAKDRETRRTQQQLGEKDQTIREAQQQLGEKDRTIQRTQQQLGEKDQMIQSLHAEQLQLRQQLQSQARQQARIHPQSQHTEFWKVPREDVTLDMQRFLGSGAWGFVVEGRFRGQRVAVKCLHNAIQHPTYIRTIRDEINIMAQIRHPNMVLLIAAVIGGDAEPPLIITELLDMSVRWAYERNLLQGSSKLSIFQDIASALNYLHLHHRGPFIHRDVNSANVLLEAKPNDQWKAKVSDFGSTKLIREAKTTGPGAMVYAAPEVRKEIGIRQTNKVDVYSYGVLLGELILEEFPVDGLTPAMIQAIQGKWSFMHSLIANCTKEHPDNRPTMSDILERLDTISPRSRPQ